MLQLFCAILTIAALATIHHFKVRKQPVLEEVTNLKRKEQQILNPESL
jgi:hypothetical protein